MDNKTTLYNYYFLFYLEIIESQDINWLLVGQFKLLAIRL
jgi:hypothetical protein